MSTPVYNKIIEILDAYGCTYETQHHEPTRTSQQASEVRGVALSAGAKAIVAKGHKTGTHFLFVMPAHLKLDGRKAKHVVGENIGFASDPEAVTECVPGSVPPFGSLFGLKTYLDPRLGANAVIHFNAGSLTDSVSMPYQAYVEIEKPIIIEVAKERE